MSLAPEQLRAFDLFEGVGPERLEWLAGRAEERTLTTGDVLFTEGEQAHELYLLLEGRLETSTRVGGDEVASVEHRAPTYLGAIALLQGHGYKATTRVPGPVRVAALSGAVFAELLAAEPEVERRIVRALPGVMSKLAEAKARHERLAALGALSAGLAHELNNPASAAGRAAEELHGAVGALQDGIAGLAPLGPEKLARVAAVGAAARARARDGAPLGALEASDREEELGAWLEEQGIAGAWELAPALVDARIDASCAVDLAAAAGPEGVEAALRWVAAGVTADALLDQVSEATRRVVDLVGAVRDYTYMDRSPQDDVDVVAGLESTLRILGHKLGRGAVTVRREFADGLPRIAASGSELNQVWTNLIDNAVDAVDGAGTIVVRTDTAGPDEVLVEVVDDGPGIPSAIQDRIFEPFFTTKDVGSGTGLGLDVAYRIVRRHHGELTVASRPGETRFRVRLPVAGDPGATRDASPAAPTR